MNSAARASYASAAELGDPDDSHGAATAPECVIRDCGREAAVTIDPDDDFYLCSRCAVVIWDALGPGDVRARLAGQTG